MPKILAGRSNAVRRSIRLSDLSNRCSVITRAYLRKIERDISDFVEIEYILHDATVCMIGLADGVEPDIVPVSFGYMDGTIYLHSAVCG